MTTCACCIVAKDRSWDWIYLHPDLPVFRRSVKKPWTVAFDPDPSNTITTEIEVFPRAAATWEGRPIYAHESLRIEVVRFCWLRPIDPKFTLPASWTWTTFRQVTDDVLTSAGVRAKEMVIQNFAQPSVAGLVEGFERLLIVGKDVEMPKFDRVRL